METNPPRNGLERDGNGQGFCYAARQCEGICEGRRTARQPLGEVFTREPLHGQESRGGRRRPRGSPNCGILTFYF